MALGADTWRVVRGVVSEGVLIVSFGVIVGLGMGALGGRVLAEVFHGVGVLDVRAAILVVGAFLLVGGTASARAAVVASRIDPALALKAE